MVPGQGQDLTGNWRGYFIPNNDANGRFFSYEIEIKENAAHQLEATTLTQLPNNITARAFASGIHSTATNLVSVKEESFDNLKLGNNFQACLMTNFLEYSSLRENEMLQGTYISTNIKTSADCGGGKVYLEKIKPRKAWVESKKYADKKQQPGKSAIKISNKAEDKVENKIAALMIKPTKLSVKIDSIKKNKKVTVATLAINATTTEKKQDTVIAVLKNKAEEKHVVTAEEVEKIKKNKLKLLPWVLVGRENKLVKTITTNNTKISFDLYDNGTIDNDTIMIFDNYDLIVDKKRLSYKAIHVEFEFSAANQEHEVIIVAHNMGTVPPNTALLVFKDGNKRQEYFITSTDKMNAKLLIQYIPTSTPAKPGQQ
jgi:hypothetical protein